MNTPASKRTTIDAATLAKAFNNAFMSPDYVSEGDAQLVAEEYDFLLDHPHPLCQCGHTKSQHDSGECTHRCAPPWATGKKPSYRPRREPVKPR